ncbi:MAG: hypothetical protein L0H64_12530 [Pseudonocardia sp.]|nr:hypothetical protein [Pseudonocardia sp.]
MTTPPPGGWFAFTPGDLDDDRLTGEQKAAAVRALQDQPTPIGKVHVLLHSFEPGRSEVRFGGLADRNTTSQAELLTAAIRELEIVRQIFDD